MSHCGNGPYMDFLAKKKIKTFNELPRKYNRRLAIPIFEF
jgi:hypothetical protein